MRLNFPKRGRVPDSGLVFVQGEHAEVGRQRQALGSRHAPRSPGRRFRWGGPPGRGRRNRRLGSITTRQHPGPSATRSARGAMSRGGAEGFEPLTFSLRTRRATNCATAPDTLLLRRQDDLEDAKRKASTGLGGAPNQDLSHQGALQLLERLACVPSPHPREDRQSGGADAALGVHHPGPGDAVRCRPSRRRTGPQSARRAVTSCTAQVGDVVAERSGAVAPRERPRSWCRRRRGGWYGSARPCQGPGSCCSTRVTPGTAR